MKIGTFLSDPVAINVPGAPSVAGVPQTSAADFGAGVGAATVQAGQALIRSGVVLGDVNRRMEADAKEERNKQIAANTASSVSKFDFSGDYINITTNAGAKPEDMATTVGNAYDTKADAYLDTITDNDVRRQTKMHLDAGRERYIQQANGFQAKAQADASVRDANDGINVSVNSVRTDPSIQNFQIASQNIDNVINTRPNISGDVKETMRTQAQQMLARRRFEAMIESSALDPTALGGVQKELHDPLWQGKLSQNDYDKLNDNLTTLTKAANSQEVALARSSLNTLKQRVADPSILVGDDEMNAIKASVIKSGQPTLMSEFAGYQRTQEIYKEFQGLPIDQMRAKVDELRKKGGITGLPQELQTGIQAGAAITNGAISPSYLAGMVNAEYSSKDIAAGNYGVVTGNTLPDGRRASDATGLAQFIGPTWRETLRKHADVLGIDPSKSDAELDAMRKDPQLSLKAAALHAQDNAVVLRNALGREPSDSDLYFAHFLGAGGAVRYLQGAAAAPNAPAVNFVDPGQVAANRQVFYSEGGKPRTVTQVNTYVTDKMMNGPSRVDYIGLKAGEKYMGYVQGALHDDLVTYMQSTGRFQMGDMSTPEGIAQRAVSVAQAASQYGVPPKPLSKGEVETFGAQIRDGDAQAEMGVLEKVAQLGNPALINAANKQLGEKDPIYSYAAGAVVARPDMKGVALDVIRGEKRMKNDKDVKNFVGFTDNDILNVWNQEVGKAIATGTKDEAASATNLRHAALALYVERSISRGSVQPGVFNADSFRDAIHAVLGGSGNPGGLAVASINGGKTVLPPKMTEGTFNTALRRMTTDDYAALNPYGNLPRYADGSVIQPDEIARSGRFESVGAGSYRIKMGDDKYALSGAKQDSSADFYIFHGDPDRLLAVAARQPNVAPLPPVVPGVQPAKPRVIP